MGDLPLAFKDYLLALSASERPETKAAEGKGLVVRAWWGLKLVGGGSLNSQTDLPQS